MSTKKKEPEAAQGKDEKRADIQARKIGRAHV